MKWNRTLYARCNAFFFDLTEFDRNGRSAIIIRQRNLRKTVLRRVRISLIVNLDRELLLSLLSLFRVRMVFDFLTKGYTWWERKEREDILGPLDRPVGNETYTIWQFQPRMSPPGRLTIFRGLSRGNRLHVAALIISL